jgi:hypothetical protein
MLEIAIVVVSLDPIPYGLVLRRREPACMLTTAGMSGKGIGVRGHLENLSTSETRRSSALKRRQDPLRAHNYLLGPTG